MATLAGEEFDKIRMTWSFENLPTRLLRRTILRIPITDVIKLDDYVSNVEVHPASVHLATLDFVTAAAGISGVRAIISKITNEITYIWTAISPLEETLASRVYDIESRLYERYPNAHFDFYVFALPESGRIADITPEGFDLLYSSDGSCAE